MLNLFQHLNNSLKYETLNQVQGDKEAGLCCYAELDSASQKQGLGQNLRKCLFRKS